MKKKFICAVCGYIYEGDAAPEKCPICKAPASKFSELKDDADMTYATVHKIGDGKPEGAEAGACEDKFRIAKNAKAAGFDAIHDTVHEMAKDEARHGAGFAGLLKRYFGK